MKSFTVAPDTYKRENLVVSDPSRPKKATRDDAYWMYPKYNYPGGTRSLVTLIHDAQVACQPSPPPKEGYKPKPEFSLVLTFDPTKEEDQAIIDMIKEISEDALSEMVDMSTWYNAANAKKKGGAKTIMTPGMADRTRELSGADGRNFFFCLKEREDGTVNLYTDLGSLFDGKLNETVKIYRVTGDGVKKSVSYKDIHNKQFTAIVSLRFRDIFFGAQNTIRWCIESLVIVSDLEDYSPGGDVFDEELLSEISERYKDKIADVERNAVRAAMEEAEDMDFDN